MLAGECRMQNAVLHPLPSLETSCCCRHSLGGALALLAAARQQLRQPGSVAAIYNYGSPRTGSSDWGAAYTRLGLSDITYRSVDVSMRGYACRRLFMDALTLSPETCNTGMSTTRIPSPSSPVSPMFMLARRCEGQERPSVTMHAAVLLQWPTCLGECALRCTKSLLGRVKLSFLCLRGAPDLPCGRGH